MYSTDFWPKSVEYMCAHVILTKNHQKTLKNPIFGLREKSHFWAIFGPTRTISKIRKKVKMVKKRFCDIFGVGETIRGGQDTFLHVF